MLDVTGILFRKWGSFSAQTVIRCWLKAGILPGEHQNALTSKDTRPGREDKEDKAIIDDLCSMVTKMTMPASVVDARSMPRVLTDNLFVEKQAGLTDAQMREAMQTWLNVEDDPQVLEDEIELELQAVEEDLASLDVEDDDVLNEEEGGGGRPESCITSSITEAEVHSRFEELRSYLYAKGRSREYSEAQYLLSKAVHSFTHETQVKRRGKERGEVQATIRDLWKG